jgi:hypothetical protein
MTEEECRLSFADRMGRAELPSSLQDRAFGANDPAAWEELEAAAQRAVVIAHKFAGRPVPADPRVVAAEALELILELQAEWGLPAQEGL